MKKVTSTILSLILVLNLFMSFDVYASGAVDNHWAMAIMNKWSAYKVINGYGNGDLKADQDVTRGEMAQIVMNLFKLELGDEDTAFKDVSKNDWYAPAVNKAYALGIISGFGDGTFRPNDIVTREQAVTILFNGFKMASDESYISQFKDASQISTYAKNAVAYFEQEGYIKGYTDGNFKPNDTVTRAEIIKMVDTMVDLYCATDGELVEGKTVNNVLIVANNVTFKNTKINRSAYISAGVSSLIKDSAGSISGLTAGKMVNIGLVSFLDDAVPLGGLANKDNGSSKNDNANNSGNTNNSNGDTNNNDNGSNNNNGNVANSWKMTWNDEFNGTQIDTSKWTYDIGNWIVDGSGAGVASGWGNNEKEYYTNSPENSYVENGKLIIKAKKEQTTDRFGTYDYTSAKLKTKGLFGQKFGKYEIRAKLPVGQGFWPAVWMLPVNDVYGGWAASGEIDILEAWGSKPDTISGALHYGGVWPNNTHGGGSKVLENNGRIDEFHTYALEWAPGEIKWLVDGKVYQTQSNWYNEDGNGEKYAYPAPFDQDFYLIMNLAVGGWFDGDPAASTLFPSTMEVDYVRAYELNNGNYKPATAPSTTVSPLPTGAKVPTADGNYISNGDFATAIQDNLQGTLPFSDQWNLVAIADFGGTASQTIDTIDGVNYAKVAIPSGGSKAYSVQLIQETTLGAGRYYKVSFDAKSSADRTINMKMGGGASRGYAVYSDSYDLELKTAMTSFEKTFQMQADTDLSARLEMNLGMNTNTVWIGNVRVEEVAAPTVDYNATKAPLPDGNGVYNGKFDKATINRMAYWNISSLGTNASASVPEDTRLLYIDIKQGGQQRDAIIVNQRGIQLEKDTEYKLTFDAKASSPRSILVGMLSKDGTIDYMDRKDIPLTMDMTGQTIEFKMTNGTDKESQLVFMVGGNDNEVFIDNVALVATTVDYSGINTHPLANGKFDKGLTGWKNYVDGSAGAVISADDKEAKIAVNHVGGETWGIQLYQGPFKFSRKVEYIVAFDVKSSLARNLEVVVENASYNRYLSKVVSATEDYTHYEYKFKIAADDDVSLKFLLGKTDGTVPAGVHDIFIDNVVCQVVGAPDVPEVPEPPTTGGAIITNGTFTSDISGWSTYTADGSNAVAASVGSELEVSYPAYAGWFKWSTQVYQDTVKLVAGKTYVLKFDARSTVARDIWVEMTGMENKTVGLTPESQTLTYEFTASANTSAGKLNFLLGTDNMDGALFVANQKVFLDNISITEKTATEPPVVGPIITNGTFTSDISGWSTYMADGSNAVPTSVGSELEVSYPAYAGWFKWSTQVYQDTIKLVAGKTYELKFDARSTVARDIWVEMTGMDAKTVGLTPESQTLTYEFTATANTSSGKLNFLLGTDNMDGALFVANQKVFLDNISITEK